MNEDTSGLLFTVSRVVGIFQELGIDYLIGGSVASSVFGEPRQTMDVDMLARILGRHAGPLFARLQSDFYADLPTIETAIQTQGCFNVIHLETMSKMDIFVRWRDPFGQAQFERRQKKLVGQSGSLELFFASPEDTVLSKLDWYKRGGEVSDRQWRDILGVLKIQAEGLDRAYMTHWAKELAVTNLLDRAWNEAGNASTTP